MKLNFKKHQGLTLPKELFKLLNTEMAKTAIPKAKFNAITFNFRDDDYNASTGGYHPVEIRVEKQPTDEAIKDHWQLMYITDFSYQGSPYPELVKEIDICFVSKRVYSLYSGWLAPRDGQELLRLFIDNFIEYHSMSTYIVTVSLD
jgi:hypothetical protein